MKKWKKRLLAIAQSLGFIEKMKDGSLSSQEQKDLFEKYQEVHGVSFSDDRALDEDVEVEALSLSPKEQLDIAAMLEVTAQDIPADPKAAARVAAAAASISIAQTRIDRQTIDALSGEPDTVAVQTVAPRTPNNMAIICGMGGHTKTHVFGISHEAYQRGKWFNDITVSRTPVSHSISSDQKRSFQEAFAQFTKDVNARIIELNQNNQMGSLDFNSMVKGEGSIDYSDLMDKAGEYIIRRTDLILAYLRSIPGVGHIFPVVSNIQNKEIAPSASFGELSQGYREGRLFKGNVAFAAEIYEVVDLMFKYNFSDLIKLEKQYIGYLNREGSSVIKWTFIEWILIHFGTQLINEQNRRRVCGVRVPQQNVASNPAMLSSDGALRAIERVEEQLKVLPFFDFGVYTKTSILDVLEGMWDKFSEVVDSTEGYQIHANARHERWYIAAYRAKYGQDSDFTGSKAQLVDLAPTNIVWVPNMPINCYKVWITVPKNIENYEDRPGEMLAFEFTKEFESILVMSRWKEGSGLIRAGVKYPTLEKLVASNFIQQWIFTSWPISQLALASTIDLSANNLFEISGSTAVTVVKGSTVDRVYKFVAKSAGTTLSNSGAFSKLGEAFVSGAAGDYIKVYAELEDRQETVDGQNVTITVPTGKFLELERKVTK